jgi:hypothetical protein
MSSSLIWLFLSYHSLCLHISSHAKFYMLLLVRSWISKVLFKRPLIFGCQLQPLKIHRYRSQSTSIGLPCVRFLHCLRALKQRAQLYRPCRRMGDFSSSDLGPRICRMEMAAYFKALFDRCFLEGLIRAVQNFNLRIRLLRQESNTGRNKYIARMLTTQLPGSIYIDIYISICW